MTNSLTIFENEDAVRLLNYFNHYKKLINISNNEIYGQNSQNTIEFPKKDKGEVITISILPPTEELLSK
jgi:hypothetical protein